MGSNLDPEGPGAPSVPNSARRSKPARSSMWPVIFLEAAHDAKTLAQALAHSAILLPNDLPEVHIEESLTQMRTGILKVAKPLDKGRSTQHRQNWVNLCADAMICQNANSRGCLRLLGCVTLASRPPTRGTILNNSDLLSNGDLTLRTLQLNCCFDDGERPQQKMHQCPLEHTLLVCDM